MKKRNQMRQGDVLLDFDNPPTALGKKLPREAGRVVLAHGEATGHTHSINAVASTFGMRGAEYAPAIET